MLKIGRSSSQDQIESTALLCSALVPAGKAYPDSIRSTPSVQQCYLALKGELKTQSNALNLLLYILTIVGYEQQSIAELHQVMYGGEETAYNDIIDTLSAEDRLKFNFFRLLYNISIDLPHEDRNSLIHLSACYLDPPQNPDYTHSLFVHFKVLSVQEVITATDMLCLYHWLTVMGKNITLKMINEYNNKYGLPVLNRSGLYISNTYMICVL